MPSISEENQIGLVSEINGDAIVINNNLIKKKTKDNQDIEEDFLDNEDSEDDEDEDIIESLEEEEEAEDNKDYGNDISEDEEDVIETIEDLDDEVIEDFNLDELMKLYATSEIDTSESDWLKLTS